MSDLWRKPYHVIFEVENKDCSIVKKIASFGLKRFKVVDVRSSKPGLVKHLVELDSEEIKKIKDNSYEIKSLVSKIQTTRKPSIWLESKGCSVCNTILSWDAFLISGKSMDNNAIMYSFMVPSFDAFQKIVSVMENSGFKVNILKMGMFEPKTGILTEKQERIFWLALKSGFFDYPRKIDSIELASRIGISPSTLSEITRRGMRRLLEYYFKK